MQSNAKIDSTFLGIEKDHGIMTFFLYLSQSGCRYKIGGLNIGIDGGGSTLIRHILETVGVNNWEELPDRYIRVDGNGQKINKIGHITEDIWFEL